MGLPPVRKRYLLLIHNIEFKQLLLDGIKHIVGGDHAKRCHASHHAVEAKVKAWKNEMNPSFCLEQKKRFTSFSPSECPHYHSNQ